MVIRAVAAVLALGAVSLTLTSCGGSGGNDDSNPTFQAYRRLWERARPQNYRYTFERSAFAPDTAIRKVVIEVRGRTTVSVTPVEAGAPIDRAAYAKYDTIDELFDLLDDAHRRGAQELLTEFDLVYGYPFQAFIDYSAQTTDEEDFFRVSDFKALP